MRASISLLLLCLLFALSPARGEEGTPVRIAVISDINGRYGSTSYDGRVTEAIQRIIELAPDLVIGTGDMVAGQRPHPPLTLAQLLAMWQGFNDTVQRPLAEAGIPLLMTPGNHDASAYTNYQLERTVYREYQSRQRPPLAIAPGGDYPFHYRADLGGVRLISVDATRSGPLDPTQRRWLAGELASRDGVTHTLVFGHLPLQPVTRGRERDVVDDPELESLLLTGRVNAYLSGHHHGFYPGQRLGIAMLAGGNLGGNQRALVGTNQRTGYNFSLLTLAPDGTLAVAAYTGAGFTQAIDFHTLPESIGQGDRRLWRRDLAANRTAKAH